jgi:hypothetical protein
VELDQTPCLQLVARLTGRHAHRGRPGWLFRHDQDCRLHSASLGLTCGLIRTSSAVLAVGCEASVQARPNPAERVRTTGRRTRKRVRTLRGFKSRRHRQLTR